MEELDLFVKKWRYISYRVISCESNRVCAVQVLHSGSILVTIIGVYLPFYNWSAEQIESYMDTLNKIQCLIDICGENTPVMVTGDFNTTLPQADTLVLNWYKRKPFNRNSALLYSFINDNNMCVPNFLFNQHVNFTYSNVISSSYIDHMLVPEYVSDMITDCKILSGDVDNLIDHFAISLSMNLPVNIEKIDGDKNPDFAKIRYVRKKLFWNDVEFQRMYSEELKGAMDMISPVNLETVTSECAAACVSSFCNQLCEAMIKSSDVCSKITDQRNKKLWWNDSCTTARNRNRLFFQIWSSLGRPRKGQAYLCYKEARKNYKRTCRQAINNLTRNRFNLIEKLSKQHKSGQMWNIIRKIRKPNGSSSAAISLQALEDYFITKFDSPAVVTDYMKNATVKVNEQYELCSNRIYLNTSVSEDQVKMYINRLKPGTSLGVDKISPEHLKFGLKTKLPKYLSLLLTVCIQFGVLPECFSEGLLIPVLKKTNIDPTIPKH